MYLYHVHSTAWSCLTQSTFINKSSNTLLSVEPFFRRCGGASTFYTLQISSTKMIPTLITRFLQQKQNPNLPLQFPACNVRFNGAFCPSLACGTTLRFGSRPRSRHDGATPWGHVLQLCLGAASKPCKVLKVLVADWFIAHFDILEYMTILLRLHYMITSAYHNYMNYLGESCVLVASQGIICKYMYVRMLWININMKKYKEIYTLTKFPALSLTFSKSSTSASIPGFSNALGL